RLPRVLARDLLQLLERLALLLRQLLRDGDAQPGDQVALAAPLQLRRAVAADAQLPAVLRAGGNLQRDAAAVGCRHFDRRAERGLCVRDGHVDDEVGPATLEQLRRLDARDDEQVAGRAAAR